MIKESLINEINKLGEKQAWNHNFILNDGVETRPGKQSSHGKNHVKLKRLQPIFDQIGLSGKNVLDVGYNEGFFSFYMAENGATVLGIDIDEDRLLKANFIKENFKKEQNEEFQNIDIYSQQFKDLDRYDLCLCLGFLHRVPDPFKALAELGEKSDMIIFEWKALKFGPHDDAFAYFSPKPVNEGDFFGTEYWLLSYTALERILRRIGFLHFYRIDDPNQKRAILVAGKVSNKIFNMPDQIVHRGRFRTFLSHTKRYLKTVLGVISGKVNA